MVSRRRKEKKVIKNRRTRPALSTAVPSIIYLEYFDEDLKLNIEFKELTI